MRILVLGGGSDIGRHIVARSASGDGDVISASRSIVPPERRVAGVHYLDRVDLLDEQSVARLVDEVVARFDGPFALVHSVGDFWDHRPLDETAPAVARSQMESHYLTLYTTLHRLLPVMARLGGGRILAFSCNSVQQNYPEMSPFTAAKAAVETLIRCVANEYASQGIQANSLALPTIRTEKVEASKVLTNTDDYLTPEALAELIVDNLLDLPAAVSGTTFKSFKPNVNFYSHGYFQRNPSGRRRPLF